MASKIKMRKAEALWFGATLFFGVLVFARPIGLNWPESLGVSEYIWAERVEFAFTALTFICSIVYIRVCPKDENRLLFIPAGAIALFSGSSLVLFTVLWGVGFD